MESHVFVLGILVLWISGNFTLPITEDVNKETQVKMPGGCNEDVEDDAEMCNTGQSKSVINSGANDLRIMAEPGENVKETKGFGKYRHRESVNEEVSIEELKDSSQLYSSDFDQAESSIFKDNRCTNLKTTKVKRSSLFDNLEVDDEEHFESANENLNEGCCGDKGADEGNVTGAMSSQAVQNVIENLEMISDLSDEKNATDTGEFDIENSENFTAQIQNAEALLQQAIVAHNPGVTTTEAFWNTDEFIDRTSD